MIKLSDTIKTILTIIGGVALSYGLYIYFNSIEFVDNSDGMPFVPILAISVIIIWLAAILTLNQIGDMKTMDFKTMLNPIKYWGMMFKGTPRWVLVLAIASFIFGVVNIGLMISNFGLTGIIDGKYVVHNHGHIIKELTEQQYLIEKARELKAITAAHIFFLGMGTGIVYPRKKIY